MILVTGATGFLGRHIVAALAASARAEARAARPGSEAQPSDLERRADASARTMTVRALVRQPVRGLAAEQVVGDVLDPASLAAAARGARAVIHAAGLVSRDPADAGRLMRLHVDGTRNVLQAAADAARIVVVSSSGTIAVSNDPDRVATEESPYATDVVRGWPYYLSKIYQEQIAREDPRVVVVLPSLLLGPGDERGSSTDDVLRFLRGKVPFVPSGGLSLVDVRDAAAATAAAVTRGRLGERYLLGGPNWTFATFLGRLERLAKVPGPRLKLPDRLARAGTALWGKLSERGGAERVAVEMGQKFWYVDSAKAERDLGFVARDPQETLIDTIRYLRAHFLGTYAQGSP
ncbi:MAG TPA: NAD-dependent epimerase/dehydratase family protein [Haliangiales bacterium]|nr:NAD-dependent epimerase/dehydratase family protein [Haliangiales bacterium]